MASVLMLQMAIFHISVCVMYGPSWTLVNYNEVHV